VKRIIFSIYNKTVDKHSSASDYKKEQFRRYSKMLKDRQKKYAKLCDADYELFTTSETNYDKIQFEKILKAEELCKHYDEVLYLDFDVVPYTLDVFFEKFNLDTVCVYSLPTNISPELLRGRIRDNYIWPKMDMYTKTCAKKAMLLLDNVSGLDSCFNTGVFGINRKSAELLNFTDRLNDCKRILDEAKVDNLYPPEISHNWSYNNEVFTSYIVERYDVPTTNIGLSWNFIIDHREPKLSAAVHMIHCVNKNFNTIPLSQYPLRQH